MRRATVTALAAALLVGPTVLAFQSGGYFEGPRVWAGAIAWAIVLVAVLVGARPPRGGWPLLALGGLIALALLSLLSIGWAPIGDAADGAAQIAALYAGTLLAALLVLREPAARRAAEPTLALGAAVVVGYGIADRLVPGLLHYARSVSAQGRLEQPLTYWNAMGELAALGVVLCVHLAGDRERPAVVNAVAAAATVPLGIGLYTSFSRGALVAGVAGLIALFALAPRRMLVVGGGAALLAAVVAAAVVSPLHGVTSLQGSLAHREAQGLLALAVTVVLALLAAGGALAARGRVADAAIPLPRGTGPLVTAIVLAGLAAALVIGARQTGGANPTLAGGAGRLVSLQSDRYDYWRVALRAFAREPLRGVGAGGWQVYWLRWRTIDEYAVDAHSLELQTLAELGVLGGLALLAFFAGVLGGARRAMRRAPGAAGASAALVVYLVHSPLDWDWQMPAVTLVAVVLAGLVLAGGETDPGG